MASARLSFVPRKLSSIPIYERLEYIVEQLRRFFYADGNGASLDDLDTQEYQVEIAQHKSSHTLVLFIKRVDRCMGLKIKFISL